MKNQKVIIALSALLLALVIAACDQKSSSKSSGDVAIKIDDDKITVSQFEDYYYTQNKLMLNMDRKKIDEMAKNPQAQNHPTLNKAKFADYLISRKLLYNKAMNDESLNKEELQAIVELNKYNGVATYYLLEKLKDGISVTDKEIDEFYNQNRNLFKGVAINDQIIARIRQQIFMKKFEMASNQFILNLIAESKVNREGLKKYLKEKSAASASEPAQEEKKEEKAPAK